MTAVDERQAFVLAIRRLHQAKDAAYRDSWKKRGEVISVLANIARKVDRLEYVIAGAPATRDESLLDTAVYLFVYGLKYQCFLADHDGNVAAVLFDHGSISGPYSDGRAGFEYLSKVNLDALQRSVPPSAVSAHQVIAAFNDLEACFSVAVAEQPALVRLGRVQSLTDATVRFLGSLARESSERYRNFLATP